MGQKNRKALEHRRQKNIEKKKKQRANPVANRKKGRGRKPTLQERGQDQILEKLRDLLESDPSIIKEIEKAAAAAEADEIAEKVEEASIQKAIEDAERALAAENAATEPAEVSEEPSDDLSSLSYEEMSVAQLKEVASNLGLTGISKLKKAELVEACKDANSRMSE